MTPRILLCGDIIWAHDTVKMLFDGIAEVIRMDSTNRADFLSGLQPGGKYAGVVGVYRQNISADYIGVFDKEIIDALAPSVKWIAHNGAGYDQIDIVRCKAKDICVSNTPEAASEATAITALYLILAAIRQFSYGERSLRALKWKPTDIAPRTRDPTGCTLAILGLGGIGLRLAELAHPLPMRVVYHSRRRAQNAPAWCEYFEDVEEMLAQTDVLSVHVPLKTETEGLVGERWIRALKRGAVIVNTARGKVIDEDALIRALEDGHITSVGLDVFPNEPEVNPRLLEFPQITLLPHMGTENRDCQRGSEVRALTNLHDFLTKGAGRDLIPEMRHPGSAAGLTRMNDLSAISVRSADRNGHVM